MVEVLGAYSNLSDQGERIRTLLEITPSGSPAPKTQTIKQVHRRLCPAEVGELVAEYQAGATVYELGCKFGISRNTVSSLLERKGVPRRKRPLSPAQIEQAVELYSTGQSSATIATQLGCDPSTVRLALLKAGIQMRDSHGRTETKKPSFASVNSA